MALTIPKLSDLENMAASCLVQAGLINRKLESLNGANGFANDRTTQEDRELRDLRLSLFESVQNLLLIATPPEFALTQGLSASVSSKVLFDKGND